MKHNLSNNKLQTQVCRKYAANKDGRSKASGYKDPMNVIITGVGGQGNVLASRVLAGMLVNRGYYVTIGETFGMSQRGGSVMSHVRMSEKAIRSPQMPQGCADIIIALEPVEALRVLTRYGNPDVTALVNSRVVYPVGVITGESDYPSLAEIKNILQKTTAENWLLDATEEAVKLGNPVLSNIIMIGALSAAELLPIDRKAFAEEISKNMTADKRRINLLAFDAGAKLI